MTTAERILSGRLGDVIGNGNILSDPQALAAYDVDGLRPAAAARPGTAGEVAELVRLAAAERLAVIATGARTKLSLGMPPRRYDLAIDLSRLNRVLAYDHGDLTLGVEPGIRLADLQNVLAERAQFLPLAVPFASSATVGGTISAGMDTPLRQAYGTPRDYLLGIEFVTGEGVSAKGGGRVVKNVAGYDVHKLMIGALGTLGIITRINFRTFPQPRLTRTFVASFERAEDAFAMRGRIAQSPLAPQALEILSPLAAQILNPGAWLSHSAWSLAASAAGHGAVLARYASDLSRMAEESKTTSFVALTDEQKSQFWERTREAPAAVLTASPAATILKFSVLPTHFQPMLERVRQIAQKNELRVAEFMRGTGIIYLALLPQSRDSETIWHLAQTCKEFFALSHDSSFRVVIRWCPAELKQKVNIWGPPREDFPLMQRLKKVFDPQSILSPGRFVGGL